MTRAVTSVTLPWVTVGRGGGAVRPLTYASGVAPGVAVPLVDGSVAPLRQVLLETHTDAFLALHNGEVVLEHYRDGRAAVELHPLMSITKSLVGCLAGALVSEGVLNPAGEVTSYVPELVGSGYACADVRELLDMRTSVAYSEDEGSPYSGLTLMGQICGWLPRTVPGLPSSLRSFLCGIPGSNGSSGGFVYRSADTEVLAWVLERATGQPLANLLEGVLLARVGAESPGTLSVDPAGVAVASGGLSVRPRDLARIGQMLLDGGAVGSEQVIAAAFIRDTRRGGVDSRDAFRSYVLSRLGSLAPQRVEAMYRNHFWVLTRGRRLLGLGVHGQMLLVDWENACVVVKLSSWPAPQDPVAFAHSLAALESTARTLGGESGHALDVLG